ncbi:MAG: polysaccharide deacetylase family protein [Lacipirellulaceae bacterium]
MEPAQVPTPAPPPSPRAARPRRRRTLSGAILRWVYLGVSLVLLAIALATADRGPAWLLWDGTVGIGNLAAGGLALCALGMASSLVGGPRAVVSRWPLLIPLGGVCAALFGVFPPKWLLARLQSDDALFFVATRRPVFALTIDDGLDPQTTPRLLDVLRVHGARATFFVLGESIAANRALAERIVAEGHELANHGWSDTPTVVMTDDETLSEVERCRDALAPFGGARWYRPGGGFVTPAVVKATAATDLRTALGSVFPFDAHLTSAEFAAAYVEGRAARGAIVVLHDCGARGERTARALERVLPRLQRKGLEAVTLSELVEGE